MELTGRVAAITGASSGIGLAIAQHLTREGAAVAIGARRGDRLEESRALATLNIVAPATTDRLVRRFERRRTT